MKLPNETFCILPWISLEASPIGTVRPCCLADEEIVDNDGAKFDLRKDNFDDIRKSNYMVKLREEFLSGSRPKTCRKCWNEERSGRSSKRLHTLDRLKHIKVDDDLWTIDPKPLYFLDLKLGNICNLKCRICGSWSSSQAAVEELQFTRREDQHSSLAYAMLKEGRWPRESPLFWSEIKKTLSEITYIEFTGGEPFLIEEHFNMLKDIIEMGIANNVEIHYNTNGTVFPEEAEEIWKHFKTVEIAISVDGLYFRFDYQRTNARWVAVEHNIDNFFKLQTRYPSIIQLQVCSTVSVFNVRYLQDIAEWLEAKPFNYVYWNMLHEPYYFSISTLPKTAKIALTQHLNDLDKKFPKHEFNKISEFMNNGPDGDGFLLKMKIRDLDQKRNQDFRNHHNEMAQLIGYQLS